MNNFKEGQELTFKVYSDTIKGNYISQRGYLIKIFITSTSNRYMTDEVGKIDEIHVDFLVNVGEEKSTYTPKMKIYTIKDSNLSKELEKVLEVDRNLVIEKFQDKEILARFGDSVREVDICILAQTTDSDDIISTCLAIDAAKRAGANNITLLLPYYSYARQDKTDHLRSSLGAKMVADIYEKIGVNKVIVIDLHADAISGFFDIPVIHLSGARIFIDYIKSLELENLCIVAPDQGAIKRNINFGKAFPDSNFALINKRRIKPNEIHSMELIGDVKGKNCLLVDDLIDTGGTLCKAANLLMENGALSVRSIITHPVLSGNAYQNIENSSLTELIVSDTIDIDPKQKSEKIRVISCSNLIMESIKRLENKTSINEINLIK